MKKVFLTAVFCLMCALVSAQDCKICGVWSGAYMDVYPSGMQYRVKVKLTIEGPKNFNFFIRSDGAWGHSIKSDDVFFVNDECNETRIKFYIKDEDEDWQTGQKFKRREIGNCIIHSYMVLELNEKENTLILRNLGSDNFYYDKYGSYIGKEWKKCDAFSCVCTLHQLED